MKRLIILFGVILFTLIACSNDDEQENHDHHDQDGDVMQSIEVDFELPEEATAGDPVELKATVTSGEELIEDAEQMDFEYWNIEDEENTTTVEATNNQDGTYTTEVTFDEPGTYEIYAHTTANGIHTMPKKSITITTKE